MAIVLEAKERTDKKRSTLRRIRSQGGIPASFVRLKKSKTK